MGLWTRLRQNLSLKLVSLAAALLLYVYVQQERNPTVPRTLLADVVFKNLPTGYEINPDTPRITVSVTGPRPSVERLKDGDIKAYADVGNLSSNQPASPVRLTYELPKSTPDVQIDSQSDFVKVQIFKQKTRKLRVEPIYRKEAPAGLRYGEPTVHPSQVTFRGREDHVNSRRQNLAIASSTEPKASIDGDFSLVPWDADNNIVEGITIEPDTVHVTVPQLLEPSEKTVMVSVTIADQTTPPYHTTGPVAVPQSVKIIGSPERVKTVNQVETEPVYIHDLTSSQSIRVSLIARPDVQVRDLQGNPITHVTVTIPISKSPAAPPVNDGAPPSPPRHENAGGP